MSEETTSNTAPANAAEATAGASDAGVLATFSEAPFTVKALLFGVLVNKLGSFVQVFLVLFMTSRGFSDVQGGVALGVYGVGSVLGVLLGGTFTDRIGARMTIVLGMAGTAVLLIAVLHVRLYPALLVSVGLAGLISQVYRPAAAAFIAELIPGNRQVMVSAMYRLALNVGTTAAPLLGTLLVSVSYDLLFYGEAAAAFGYAAIVLVMLPRQERAAEPTRKAAVEARQSNGYRAVLRDRRYVAYLLAMLLNAAVYIQYLSTLPLAIRDAGFDTFWYGVMVAINGAVVILFELLMTKVVQNWRVRTVLTVGFCLLGSGMALYALPGGVAVFVVGTLLWTLAEIIEGPTMFAYPAIAAPAGAGGRYLGAAHAVFGIGSAIGPAAGVALWSGLGRTSWLVIGAVSVLALIPAWFAVGRMGSTASLAKSSD
ncbi:MFS transporter [Streptomyces virginiae]|uniref:MFS transporter n=1 Tax=Streptomyces virginiae TaxID=1961 RepID=A0ABZ1TJP4_STRVG|nr:MFS transporter [Streptomyces virginiae]